MAAVDRKRIEELYGRIADAFNRGDLDAVMDFFAEDALYIEFNGTENRGKAQIRSAFEPQFRGDFGKVLFHHGDFFFDEHAGKALSSWRCTLELDEQPQEWSGLDIYVFEGELIKEKHTYTKAAVPLLTEVQP
jgi:ketosteroid isomerase-like protein